ncbi:hypothetical protein Tco_1502614 [Tanacetum coccineum]
MNSSMCITLIGRDNIYSGNPFPFIGKGIRVYKFNLHYVASIKWVVELPFNARLLSSTSLSVLEEFCFEIQFELPSRVVLVKRCGYLLRNWSSRSHVNSGPLLEFHQTLTIGMQLSPFLLT